MKLTARIGEQEHEVVIERRDALYVLNVDGQPIEVDARKLTGDFYTILMRGRSYEVSVAAEGDAYRVRHGASAQTVMLSDPSRRARQSGLATGSGPATVAAVMPGRIVRVLVAAGDEVTAGQGLLVVEAMKMENEIASPKAGRVTAVHVEAGRAVESGTALLVVE